VKGLEQLAKHHREWTKIVQSFGSKEPEDVVQDMYVRISQIEQCKWIGSNGINRAYIWITLRNIFLTSVKKQDIIYEELIQDDEQEQNEAFEKLIKIINFEVDKWQEYDKLLFRTYIKTGMSLRDIAQQSHISLRSIFDTVKKCKDRLKDAVGEDYEDYKNLDYDKIQDSRITIRRKEVLSTADV
jgi:RNA polymerase sigma factor (sigma-70 family)